MAAVGFLSHYLNGPLQLCPTPYNRKYNVLSMSLNKTFPSFLPSCLDERGLYNRYLDDNSDDDWY